MPPKLLVTGTRRGRPDVRAWLLRWSRQYGAPSCLVVGGLPEHRPVGELYSVDGEAYLFGKNAGWPLRVFRADWDGLGKAAGPLRNQAMVDFCRAGDVCLGFPDAESRGTWDCMRRAHAAGLTTYMLPLLRGDLGLVESSVKEAAPHGPPVAASADTQSPVSRSRDRGPTARARAGHAAAPTRLR